MKKLVLEEPGLKLISMEAEIDSPARDEIQVDVAAVGLNPVDAKTALQGHPAWQYPHVPGLDAVGHVSAVGSEATHFHPGQRVLWHGDLRREGALAEKINIPARIATAVSDEIDDLRAAALPCAGMTAWQAVDRMQLKPRQTVLIEAGAGGVGYYAIQLAKHKGAMVITTASSQHHQFLGAVGADRVIDYHSENVAEAVRQFTPALDAVLDSVDGEATARDMSLLRRGGHFVSLLGLPDVADVDLFSLAPTIHIIGLGGAHQAHEAEEARGDKDMHELAALGEKLVSLLAEGELQSPSIERIPFDASAVSNALEREASGKMAGKQVVIIH